MFELGKGEAMSGAYVLRECQYCKLYFRHRRHDLEVLGREVAQCMLCSRVVDIGESPARDPMTASEEQPDGPDGAERYRRRDAIRPFNGHCLSCERPTRHMEWIGINGVAQVCLECRSVVEWTGTVAGAETSERTIQALCSYCKCMTEHSWWKGLDRKAVVCLECRAVQEVE